MSNTSFRAGPVGDRNPELSTTQLVLFSAPVLSTSLLGLRLLVGEGTDFDGPALLVPALADVSCSYWKKEIL